MFTVTAYTAISNDNYLDIGGIYSPDVLIVDRNGIGIKHSLLFTTTETTNVITYEWFGIKDGTISATNYMIPLYNITTAFNREILLEFGPTPVEGTTFGVYNGSVIAKYTIQSGDTTSDVRDGLKAAIDAETWPFGITTGSISTNQLQINIDTLDDLTLKIGQEKYKKGRYVTINGINYIIVELESFTAYPTLPGVNASYNINDLTQISGSVENYLLEPLTTYTYTDSVTGTTDINNIPGSGGVPIGECVIDYYNQKIWFDANLNVGETIKIFQK